MKQKIIFYLGIFFLLLSGILTLWTLGQEREQTVKQQKQIQKIRDTYQTDDSTFGILTIPRLSLEKIIANDIAKKTLDQNIVGRVPTSKMDPNGTIILAAHNNRGVFQNLKKLQKEDEIIIERNHLQWIYKVTSQKVIEENDMTNFTNEKGKLILITCEQTKRRIIIAYLKT